MPSGVSFAPTVKKALEGVPYFYNVSGSDKPRREKIGNNVVSGLKKLLTGTYTHL